jgi:hypothetical protein
MFLKLTVSYGQIGINEYGDTIICYTTEEAKKIAKKLINLKECNLILIASNKEIKLLDNQVLHLNNQLTNLDSISYNQNKIIKSNDYYIKTLEKSLKKEKVKVKTLKLTSLVTSVACGVLLILHLIK